MDDTLKHLEGHHSIPGEEGIFSNGTNYLFHCPSAEKNSQFAWSKIIFILEAQLFLKTNKYLFATCPSDNYLFLENIVSRYVL